MTTTQNANKEGVPESNFINALDVDYESRAAILHIQKCFNKTYEQSKFSLKYTDESLEEEFFKFYTDYINRYSRFAFIAVSYIALSIIIIQIFYIINNKDQRQLVIYTMIITCVLHVCGSIIYFLSRKYTFFLKNLSNLNCIMLIIFTIEVNLTTGDQLKRKDVLITLGLFFFQIAVISYSKINSAIAYLACIVFSSIRTYFIIEDTARYVMFNLNLLIGLTMTYFFERLYH